MAPAFVVMGRQFESDKRTKDLAEELERNFLPVLRWFIKIISSGDFRPCCGTEYPDRAVSVGRVVIAMSTL